MSKEEFNEELKALMKLLTNDAGTLRTSTSQAEMTQVYRLHNIGIDTGFIIGNREKPSSCGSCSARTFKRLKDYYDNNIS